MRRLLISCVTLSLVAACASDDPVTRVGDDTLAPSTTDTGTTDTTTSTLEPGAWSTEAFAVTTPDWSNCGDGLECAYIDVPLDYSNTESENISIYMTRRPATDRDRRIGTLLVNPGGPGFGGSYLAKQAEYFFSSDLLERFDILGFDPRGTGLSEPAIDCIDDYDDFFAGGDITPDTDAERLEMVDSMREFTETCFRENGEILPHVGTNNVARDM
ncbi:MAG: hypothetical protein ACKOCE_06700, partial [Acidimicrobiia bacterium]